MRFLNSAALAALAVAVLSGPVFAADAAGPAKDITRQAYLDQAAKRFDAMDTNHDGTLSSAERRAAHHNHRHMHGGASNVAPSAPATGK